MLLVMFLGLVNTLFCCKGNVENEKVYAKSKIVLLIVFFNIYEFYVGNREL